MLQKIFMKTLDRCIIYTQHWKTLHAERRGIWEEAGTNLVEEVNIGLLNFKWVTRSATLLLRNIQTCRTCTRHSLLDNLSFPTQELLNEESDHLEGGEESDQSNDLPTLPRENQQAPDDMIYDPMDDSGNGPWQFDKNDDDYASSPIQSPKFASLESSNIWVFGKGKMAPLLPARLLNWTDRGFRTGGQFWQTIRTIQQEQEGASLQPISPTPMVSHIDRCRPAPESNTLRISGKQMLEDAGSSFATDASRRIFVRGKAKRDLATGDPSQYLALDLEEDAVNVPPDSVKVSVDLDSLIWVTPAVNFEVRSFQLFLTPTIGPGLRIDKNNFVYVNLLSPPSNEMELHEPIHRARTEMPLSRIPHLEFGYCGQGSRRINFFAFFPRMIWKNDKGRYSTRIPGQLVDLWHENAILPACRAAFDGKPGFSEYQPHSLQEIRDRTGAARQKEINVIGANQKRVMEELCRIVKSEESLSCFGSFFIVADGRGMKFTTKQCTPPNESAPSFNLIKAEFPDLCWDVMQDRSKGELYLDIGTGYHSDDQRPLVGFWRIPSLLDSFKLMGSKKPTIFHFGTQKFHGGASAEISVKSKAKHHFISRISYCLAFEVVRNPGVKDYICSDADVVERSPRFQKECQRWLGLISSAALKSYGVRDEVRGLAGAVLELLNNSVEQVCEN
jgi:hypothetical protein